MALQAREYLDQGLQVGHPTQEGARKISDHLPLSDLARRWAAQFQDKVLTRSLAFGEHFNHSLATTNLPETLETLTLGRDFNQPFDGVRLPSSLQTLVFGAKFNRSLDNTNLPSGLCRSD